MSLFEVMEHSPYRSICQRCALLSEPALILTGFDPCHEYPCDQCGHVTNLALVKCATRKMRLVPYADRLPNGWAPAHYCDG